MLLHPCYRILCQARLWIYEHCGLCMCLIGNLHLRLHACYAQPQPPFEPISPNLSHFCILSVHTTLSCVQKPPHVTSELSLEKERRDVPGTRPQPPAHVSLSAGTCPLPVFPSAAGCAFWLSLCTCVEVKCPSCCPIAGHSYKGNSRALP